MRSTISRTILGTLLVGLSQISNAQQVPVVDIQANAALSTLNAGIIQQTEAISIGAAATTEAINANGKILGNINQALANALVDLAKTTETIRQSRRNSDLYDPSMGAKPQSSCGVLSSTAAVAQGDNKRAEVKTNMDTVATNLLEASKNSPAEESKSDRSAFRLRKQLTMELEIAEEHGVISMADHAGLPVSESSAPTWAMLHQKLLTMAVPNPVELPENVDDPNQSPLDAVSNSKKIVQLNRQKYIGEILSDQVSGRTKTYQSDWIRDLLFEAEDGSLVGADSSVLSQLEEGVSKNDADRILSTYRLRNPEWVTHTSAQANEVGLMRDGNLMAAQTLDLLHSILAESRRTNQLLAFVYAHQIELSGPPE